MSEEPGREPDDTVAHREQSPTGPPQPPPGPAPAYSYGPYPPGPYGQYPGPHAQYPPPAVGPSSTNGFAIASLVLGIIWVYWIGSILALVFGYVGMGQIDRSGGRQGGRGLAIAGIVLGWIGVGFLLLIMAFSLLAFVLGE